MPGQDDTPELARPRSSAFEERLRGWIASSERRFEANASANGDVLELSMLDIVGEDWWTGGGITSKVVQEKLSAYPKAKTIKILLNSPGGDAFEGLAVQSLLRRHGARVEIEVVGLAASAASIIAMAGDSIAMHEGSLMMVHQPWTFAVGDADEMRTTAEFLDKVNASGLDVYTRRTGRTREDIAELVSAETWMTAHEAVKEKFATSVVEGAAPAPAKARAAAQAFMSARKPTNRVAATMAAIEREVTAHNQNITAPPVAPKESAHGREESNNMKLSAAVLALLGLPEDADQARIEAAIKAKCQEPVVDHVVELSGVKLVGASNEAEAAARITDMQKLSMAVMGATSASTNAEALTRIMGWKAGSDQSADLLKQVADLKTQTTAAQRDGAIQKLSREGRLAPSQHEWARSNFATAESLETFALTLPPMAAIGNVTESNDTTKMTQLDASDREICKALGLSEDVYLEQKKLELQSAKARKAG